MALRIDGQIYKVLESEFKAGGGQAARRRAEAHHRAERVLQDAFQ